MREKTKALRTLIYLVPFGLAVASLWFGTVRIPLLDVFKTLLSPLVPSWKAALPAGYVDIVFGIRLPRIILALAAGSALSISGASLQALFKNPLVNEYILGLSSGAGFGAALSLVFLPHFPPQLLAFAFAIVAVLLVLSIASRSESPAVSLLLTGVIISAFFTALLSLVELFASPYSLQALFYWLMGNLSLAGWAQILPSLPVILAGSLILFRMRWRLNVLSMSDDEARSLGIHVRREKFLVVVLAALVTSAAVSTAGIIGWIGLIVPHLVRMMFGAENRRVLPLSAALGASFLLAADDATRSLASFEVPVGIFTSLIGIPLFILLLRRSSKVWL
ncbi:MAG: iron ABC transporter permease [Acidobacteriota bacterium]|nr:iron ABC transporter permease [Acidobacteriota bacterium]